MDEPKRPRGRPATGRKRNKNMAFKVTEEEKNKILQYMQQHDYKTVADLVINLIATK